METLLKIRQQDRERLKESAYGGEVWYIEDKVRAGRRLLPYQQKIWDRHSRAEAKKRRKRGLKLVEFRVRVGISQSKLAELLGISRRSVCYYEKGAYAPKRQTVIKLCYLGYDYETCQWSLTRRKSIRRLGECSGSVYVEDVLIFYKRWFYEKHGSQMEGPRYWDRLSKSLDLGGGYAFKK